MHRVLCIIRANGCPKESLPFFTPGAKSALDFSSLASSGSVESASALVAVNCRSISSPPSDKSRQGGVGKVRPFPTLTAAVSRSYPSPNGDALASFDKHLQLLFRCLEGGGQRGVDRHTKVNKKVLVRDRIRSLIDPDSDFFELGATAGVDLEYGDIPCGGIVTGVGRVSGVSCLFIANDGTVKGGTSYPITVEKAYRAMGVARHLHLPCLYVADSGGAFLPMQSEIFPDKKHGGRSFRNQTVMSSLGIPQLALVVGLCTAGGAYTPAMCDDAVIVKRIGNIYLGGPPLVKAATGEVVTGEELGGADLHCSVSGVTDYYAENEAEAFHTVRDVVASLNLEEEELLQVDADAPLLGPETLDYLSGLGTLSREDTYSLIACLADGSRFLEFKARFGEGHLVTGFSRINGSLVGLVANCSSNNNNKGPLQAADGQKGSHFIQLCDSRDIPLVFLQNGSKLSPAGDAWALKERAKMSQHVAVATVPKIAINVSGLYADEMFTMCGPSFRPGFHFFWPQASMAKTSLATLEEISGRGKSQSNLKIEPGSAQFWASRSSHDGVILPRDTRLVLGECLRLSSLHRGPKARGERGQGRMTVRM